MANVQYPTSQFDPGAQGGPERRGEFIAQIADAPARMRAAAAVLSPSFKLPYCEPAAGAPEPAP